MLGWEKREEKEGRRKGSREERREEGSGGRESEIICISTAVQLWPGEGGGEKVGNRWTHKNRATVFIWDLKSILTS